jgi:peptidyl-prolyl cis-trans isomerase SurA
MIRLVLCLTALLALWPASTIAQEGLFSPRIIVNGRAVTQFEFEQRLLMLQLFRAPGDLEEEARNGLIDDRLKMAAGAALGIAVTPDGILAGMNEFAGRANLTAEEFITALGQAGVSAETFRDFVEAGLLWREVIRARFVGRVTISEAEIDRAIAATTRSASVRVLLSEIIIPAPPGGEGSALALARRIRAETRSEADFARAARQYSASGTAGRGGRMDWVTLGDLPAALAPVVLGLGPGGVSEPLQVPDAVAIFQLRAIEQGPPVEATTTSVDYARVNLTYAADPVAEANRLRTGADTCNDLNGLVPEEPEPLIVREALPVGQIPGDIALELARLDPGEAAPMLRGGVPVLVMLCSRTPILDTPIDRGVVAENLLNQRLNALADGFLEELRADAIITEPGQAPPSDATGN